MDNKTELTALTAAHTHTHTHTHTHIQTIHNSIKTLKTQTGFKAKDKLKLYRLNSHFE